jgi:hypothetical protein
MAPEHYLCDYNLFLVTCHLIEKKESLNSKEGEKEQIRFR